MLRSRKLPCSQLNGSAMGCPAGKRLLHLMGQIKSYLSAKEFLSLSETSELVIVCHFESHYHLNSEDFIVCIALLDLISDTWTPPLFEVLQAEFNMLFHSIRATHRKGYMVNLVSVFCSCFLWKMVFSFLISFRLHLKCFLLATLSTPLISLPQASRTQCITLR